MKTITTIEEVLAVVDPETVLLDGKCRSYQWSLTMGGEEGWCSVDDPTPITSHHLLRFGPLKVIHCTIPTAADQPTTEPSAVERAAEALHRHESGSSRWDGCEPCTKRAQVLANAGLLAPAPQPAADTETEVQARALREAAEAYGPGQITFMGSAQEYTRAWIRARADRIERGEEA